MIANRAVVILVTAVCLAILYVRFTISERPGNVEKFSMLSLSTAAERVYYDSDSFQENAGDQFEKPDSPEKEMLRVIPLPEVAQGERRDSREPQQTNRGPGRRVSAASF